MRRIITIFNADNFSSSILLPIFTAENLDPMSMTYIWQDREWPLFRWSNEQIACLLGMVHQVLGRLTGIVSMFGLEQKNNTFLDAITQEIVGSAEIEGEVLNHDSVRSSVARQLGLPYAGLPRIDHYVEGVVQVMVDATQHGQWLRDSYLIQ